MTAAQRLVRKICVSCKEAYRPSAEEAAPFGLEPVPEVLYRGRAAGPAATWATRGAWRCTRCSGINAPVRRMVNARRRRRRYLRRHAIESVHGDALRAGGFAGPSRGTPSPRRSWRVVADQDRTVPLFEYEVADSAGAPLSTADAQSGERGATHPPLPRAGASSARHPSHLLAGAFGRAGLARARRIRFAPHLRRMHRAGRGWPPSCLFTGQLCAPCWAAASTSCASSPRSRPRRPTRNFRGVLVGVRDSITCGLQLRRRLGQHRTSSTGSSSRWCGQGRCHGSCSPVAGHTHHLPRKDGEPPPRKSGAAIAYPAVILTVAPGVVFVMVIKDRAHLRERPSRAPTQCCRRHAHLIWVSGLVRHYTLPGLPLRRPRRHLGLYLALQTEAGRGASSTTASSRCPSSEGWSARRIMAAGVPHAGVLLNSGIPLIEAMETVSKVAGNVVIENAPSPPPRGGCADGGPSPVTLREIGQFPAWSSSSYATGEESGTLPPCWARLALYYEQRVDNAVATLSTLIEPVMIVDDGRHRVAASSSPCTCHLHLGRALRGGVRVGGGVASLDRLADARRLGRWLYVVTAAAHGGGGGGLRPLRPLPGCGRSSTASTPSSAGARGGMALPSAPPPRRALARSAVSSSASGWPGASAASPSARRRSPRAWTATPPPSRPGDEIGALDAAVGRLTLLDGPLHPRTATSSPGFRSACSSWGRAATSSSFNTTAGRFPNAALEPYRSAPRCPRAASSRWATSNEQLRGTS